MRKRPSKHIASKSRVRFKVMLLMLSIRESREAWHMAAAKLSDEAFSAILEAHPGLRERFASIAMAVANSGENLKEADGLSRKCGCWGERRCKDGPRPRWKRPRKKFVNNLRCIAKVKKTPLAYEIW